MAYILRTDIEDIFGKENVKKWADLDSAGVTADITARITRAITAAEDRVNSRLRNGPYTIPFGSPESIIQEITAKFAGLWLYNTRGTR